MVTEKDNDLGVGHPMVEVLNLPTDKEAVCWRFGTHCPDSGATATLEITQSQSIKDALSQKRAQLEEEIANLIKEFTKDTGFKVDYLSLHKNGVSVIPERV